MNMNRGNTLVGLLVTIALMAVLAVALFKGSGMFGAEKASRPDGHGTTVLGSAEWAARDTVCRSNLGQVRAALQIAESTNEEKYPETLQETKLPKEFYKCPVGKEKYLYDPATGKVSCPHPGHEKY
jgi:Tfp pilus assembly protein PilE